MDILKKLKYSRPAETKNAGQERISQVSEKAPISGRDDGQIDETDWDIMAGYQVLLENMPAAIYTCDTQGYITLYNKAAAVLWGKEPEIGKDRWCGSWRIYGPDGITPLELDTCPMARTLKEGKPIRDTEIVIERPDRTRSNVQPYPVPLFDKKGRISGAVNLLLDITDRKTVEKELENLAAIVHSSTDPVIGKTLDGVITSWNKAAERIFGYTADEIIGQYGQKLIPEDRLNEEALILELLKKGEVVESFETKRITKDKKVLDISLTISPVKDKQGNLIGLSKIVRDITAQKAVREALLESEERLRMASESTQLGTWEYHPLQDKLIWSDECRRIYDVPADFDPTNAFILEHMHLDDRPLLHEEFVKALDPNGDGKFHMHYRFTRANDDKWRWLKVSGKTYFNSQRQPLRFIGNMLDITEEKLAEKLIRESEERLRMAVLATRLGTWEFFPVTRKLILSEESKEMFAFPRDKEVDFRVFEDHIHPEDRDALGAGFRKSMDPNGDGNYDVSSRIIRFDGGVRWIRTQGKVFFDSEQHPIRLIGTILDITDQKTAEKALAESERRSRLAIEAANMGTFEWDLISQEFNSSQRLNNIFGFLNQPNITHKNLTDAFHPADKPTRDKAIKDSADKGSLSYEARVIWPDKSIHWVRVHGKVAYDELKQPVTMYGIAVDITEEKISTTALEDGKTRLNIAIEASELGMLEYYIKTDQAKCSDRYLEILGFEKGSNPSRQEQLDKIHPDDIVKRDVALRNSLKKGVMDFELRIRPDLKTVRWIKVKGKVFYDENQLPEKIVGTAMDITETKTMLNTLQESELKLQTISSASPVGLWMTDDVAQNTFVNETWIQWTGIPFEKQLGTGWLDRVLEEDREKAHAKFWECLQKKEKYIAEFRIISSEGEMRWCLTEGAPYYDANGEFEGYAGSVTDITDLKKSEARKDDFIKMASHELKTPITSIKGYVQLLQKIYDELDLEKYQASRLTVKSSLNTISKQVSKLTRLVSELLDLTRIESGKLELQKTEFVLDDLLKETVSDMRHTTSQHRIVLRNDFMGNIFADKDRISQVLVNLLTNAIKYSPDADCIEIDVKENGNMINIKIKDYGIGIEEKDQKMIFQRFYRVEGKNEQTYPGFGIGLFIVDEIIQRHNGNISVESKKNAGSIFTVSLPLALES
jgi:PAS domain S-box-containing protein